MGKYMRKAKVSGEVAVMEVSQSSFGVRTRARALALQKSASNTCTASAASYLQLRSRRLLKPLRTEAEKTKEPAKEKPRPIPRLAAESVNSGSASPILLCSPKKNGDACFVKEPGLEGPFWGECSPKGEDALEPSSGENVLETEGRERIVRETTPSSSIRASAGMGTPGSATRPTDSIANNPRVHRTTNLPTSHEMEEFFAGVEQQQQRIFTEKYNYDPVTDLPLLPGRYEWVRLDG